MHWSQPQIKPKLAKALSVSPHWGVDGHVQGELPPSTCVLTVFTSLACYPGAPQTATETRLAWAGIGEDCRPRTTWRPLTLAGSTVLPPLRLTGGIATPTGRYHGRMLIHPSPPACATPSQRCLHTRRSGTLASPPPPVQR